MATPGPQSATHVRRPLHCHQGRTNVCRTKPGKRSWPRRPCFRFPPSAPTPGMGTGAGSVRHRQQPPANRVHLFTCTNPPSASRPICCAFQWTHKPIRPASVSGIWSSFAGAERAITAPGVRARMRQLINGNCTNTLLHQAFPQLTDNPQAFASCELRSHGHPR